MAELTRKEYRQQQKNAQRQAAARDEKRQEVERDYAKQQREAERETVLAGAGDQRLDPSFQKVNALKKKLNWAIGIVVVLIIITYAVMLIL
ncbi:hypothetical protein [Lacticaseibacillus yichunensis]|uniref:DUF1510 domain-containing protein n=1 Tax=Lacticaseibacillus yichunensis TaxID=2486015 RepID=A0ABW4CQH0_9LACO|nr:hypothetical protein [Lacticaseibacillus yichunensis]